MSGKKTEGSRWKRCKRLGAGNFGEVWEGVQIDDETEDKNTKRYALKYEQKASSSKLLNNEYKIMKRIQNNNQHNKLFIPHVFDFIEDKDSNLLVMDLLGPSIATLKNPVVKESQMLTIAEQTILGLKQIHQSGIVHRDIKPENIVMNLKKQVDDIYFIDFGLSHKIPNQSLHESLKSKLKYKSVIGTPRYASIRSHNGMEQSFGDEIESLVYTLIFLMVPRLPWQGIKATPKVMNQKIREQKEQFDINTMDIPPDFKKLFSKMLNDGRNTEFGVFPHYDDYLEDINQIRKKLKAETIRITLPPRQNSSQVVFDGKHFANFFVEDTRSMAPLDLQLLKLDQATPPDDYNEFQFKQFTSNKIKLDSNLGFSSNFFPSTPNVPFLPAILFHDTAKEISKK